MFCDGWCATLSTTVNNKNATTYWCAPVPTCRNYALGMGGDNNCGTISSLGNTLTGCCCSESVRLLTLLSQSTLYFRTTVTYHQPSDPTSLPSHPVTNLQLYVTKPCGSVETSAAAPSTACATESACRL